jgi:tRNA G10  N-methylase Trm11
MKHFLLYGTHPELSQAEAEAVLGTKNVQRQGQIGLVDSPSFDGDTLQERLAGVVKLGEIILEEDGRRLTSTSLAEKLADQIEARPRADRVLFGLTLLGTNNDIGTFKKLPIELKRQLQERGRSVRWVTGDHGEISPAAVSKLKLNTEGYDFVLVVERGKILVGLTSHVQNADAWSLRDYGRPFRDAKTGMLPPKLARMMVNLAAGESELKSLLDPFCGGGTVLMEAGMLFPDARLVGSDIDPKQIAGTKENYGWLNTEGLVAKSSEPRLIVTAAQHIDQHLDETFDAIVTEGYLGEPLRGHEPLSFLMKNKENVERVWNESLPKFAKRLNKGGRLVCVWPAFVVGTESVVTDATAAAKAAGFTPISKPLAYGREDQRVLRRIQILVKD